MTYRAKQFIRRRTFLINNDLQYTILISSMLYVLLFVAVVSAALFIPLFVKLGDVNRSSWEVQQTASEVVLYLHAHFWPAALFSLVLIGLLSMRNSHRIAGPLYKITLLLHALKSGNLPKAVQVRKSDRLAAEVVAANEMLEILRGQVGEIQAAQAGLNDAIAACDKLIDHASPQELMQRLLVVREKAAQLANRIGYFTVE